MTDDREPTLEELDAIERGTQDWEIPAFAEYDADLVGLDVTVIGGGYRAW